MKDLRTLTKEDLLADFADAIEPGAGYGGEHYDELRRRLSAGEQAEARVAALEEIACFEDVGPRQATEMREIARRALSAGSETEIKCDGSCETGPCYRPCHLSAGSETAFDPHAAPTVFEQERDRLATEGSDRG